jgi:hypothetical protein
MRPHAEDTAQEVNVSTGKQLRSHVTESANHQALLRKTSRIAILRKSRDTKIHDLDVAIRQHHDIGRLDITMNHSIPMGAIEPLCDLRHDVALLKESQWLVRLDNVLEVFALQIFHDEERLPILFAKLMYGDNVLVAEVPGDPRLVPKTAYNVRARIGQNLDGDRSADLGSKAR